MMRVEDDRTMLTQAFDAFIRSTQTLEEAYRRLESRMHELDRELAAKNRELEVTSEHLRNVLESMSDGVIAATTDGDITTFNRAACSILGFDAPAILGKPFKQVFGRDFTAAPGRQAMELRAVDGADVPVTESDSPVLDRSNARIGMVKVFQDLREIEALREQVRQKDRLAAIGEMAATVAHEIRNPLGGIRGFAALLQQDIEPADPRARLVERIIAGAKDLDRVVTELLEFTRPIQLRMRSTRCADLIDAVLGYVDFDSGAVRFDNAAPRELAIFADPDKLRQVLLNILLNAVQSIRGSGTITITAEEAGGGAVIEVQDTGCGMTPEQLEQVFSPFFTTKEKGTGLGLAVAEKIVMAHGGRIEARSSVGHGSTFEIHLPQERLRAGKQGRGSN